VTLPVDVSVDRYSVSCLPKDHPLAAIYTLYVVYRRNLDGWVVTDGVANLDRAGNRLWPSVSGPAERARYTFASEVEALEVARGCAAVMTVEGRSVADVVVGWTVPGAHAVGGDA